MFSKRLGWEEVEVNLIEVKKEDEELLLTHYNKQRIKSFKDLINEYLTLDNLYKKGQGRRTDLTSVKSNISYISLENTLLLFPKRSSRYPYFKRQKKEI